jgi:hypothetical protein
MAPEKKPASATDTLLAEAEPAATVVDFRTLLRGGSRPKTIPQVSLPPMRPMRRAEGAPILPRVTGVPPLADLTGKRKLLIAMGPQNAGKTMEMRAIASELKEAGALDGVLFAAADPGVASLGLFVAHIEQPDSNSQEDGIRFVRDLHTFLVNGGDQRPMLTVLDCGGNNTALPALLEENGAFVSDLESAGVAVVLAYFFVPRTDDLTLLDHHNKSGFRSAHTMLVLNLAKAERGAESFETIRAQEPYQRLVRDGAAEVLLPRLSEVWAQAIEDRRLPFWQAREGQVPAGLAVEPLEQAGRIATAEWLAKWRTAHQHVASWLR